MDDVSLMDQNFITYLEFIARFIFGVLSRFHDKKVLNKWIEYFEKFLQCNSFASYWFLEFFANHEQSDNIGISCLIQSTSQECRVGFVRCSIAAIKCLRSFEKSKYIVPSKSTRVNTGSVIVDFMFSFYRLCIYIAPYWRNFAEYFRLFRDFAILGDYERQWLLNVRVISEFSALFLGHESPVLSQQESHKYEEIGSKTEVADTVYMLDLIRMLLCSCAPQPHTRPPTFVRLSKFLNASTKFFPIANWWSFIIPGPIRARSCIEPCLYYSFSYAEP